jgi:hypothetical protein
MRYRQRQLRSTWLLIGSHTSAMNPLYRTGQQSKLMDENEPRQVSRRQAVGLVGFGVTAAAAGPTFSQQTDLHTDSPYTSESTMEDPRSKYPKPPFKQQTQPWPGLANKMDPRPDHGETSYRGSGRLAGRKALITGGDSGMGRAAAIAYAREGADVAINYFPTEEPDAREVIQLIKDAGRTGLRAPASSVQPRNKPTIRHRICTTTLKQRLQR